MPVFCSETGWFREPLQKSIGDFLLRFWLRGVVGMVGADVVQASGCGEKLTRSRLGEDCGGFSAPEAVEERFGDARDARGAARMSVGGARGDAQAGHGGGLQAVAVGQGVPPSA